PEDLHAVDYPLVAIADGGGCGFGELAARFGRDGGEDHLARGDRAQSRGEALGDSVLAVRQGAPVATGHAADHVEVHVRGDGGGGIAAGEAALREQQVVDRFHAHAAVFGGDG